MERKSLDDHAHIIRRLRAHLKELASDLRFVKKGGRLHYAVDFTEVYAYLHRDEETPPHGLGLGGRASERARDQHRLAMTHLFHSLSPPVCLFPPYAEEMWDYARAQLSAPQPPKLVERASGLLRSFDARTIEALSKIGTGKAPDARATEQVLSIVKDDFEAFCV